MTEHSSSLNAAHGAGRVDFQRTDPHTVQCSSTSLSLSSKEPLLEASHPDAPRVELELDAVDLETGAARKESDSVRSGTSSFSSSCASFASSGEEGGAESGRGGGSSDSEEMTMSTDEEGEETREEESEDEEGDGDAPKERYLSFSIPTLGPNWEGHRLMCAHAYRSFLLIGTNQGAVGVLDPLTMATQRVFLNHEEPISDTSCDAGEGLIGSSDKSGGVAIQNLHDRADVWRRQMGLPIQSLALHPCYPELEERPLICAGKDKVFLLTRIRFLTTRRCVLLHEGHGRVFLVRWGPAKGDFVAWLTDAGITVLHYGSRRLLRRIPRPAGCGGLELYPPTLLWEAPGALLCGWGGWVEEVHLRERSPSPTSALATGEAPFEITSPVGALRPGGMNDEGKFRVCGLAPFGRERYLILACIVQEEGVMRDLEVCVVQRDSMKDLYRARIMVDYIHPLQLGLTFARFPSGLAHDNLSPARSDNSSPARDPPPPLPPPPRGAQEKALGSLEGHPNAPQLENEAVHYPPKGTVFFIISVDTIIRGIPSDEDDHVEFLLRNGDFESAYRYALRHRLQRHLLKDVFRQLLEWYMANDKLDKVAVLLPSFIGDNLAEWERWIYRFDQRGESWKLVDVVPNYTFEEAENAPWPRQSTEHYHSLQDFRIADAVLPSNDDVEAHTKGAPRNGSTRVVGLSASLRSSIGRDYYDLILIRCLERDPVLFNGAVHHFCGLFNADIVLKATKIKYEEICESGADPGHARAMTSSLSGGTEPPALQTTRYSETQKLSLCEAYAFLLQREGHDDEALQVLLLVSNSTELIGFVRRARVFAKAREILPELFARSAEATIGLLLEHARGGAADPLGPESVVARLAGCERRFLWRYLHALRGAHAAAFAALAKRHAQLLATLYIEFDRAALLPFLREMCMYVERVKDIYALCMKYHLLDEMVFLMARIGRGEEGLRVIVRQMHDVAKAVQFIREVPSKDEQAGLFKRLVKLVVEYNASLPVGADGRRFILHECGPGETFAAIARRYDVDEGAVRLANGARKEEGEEEAEEEAGAPPNPCRVPLDLLSALLRAAADPACSGDDPVIDAAYIIARLPPAEFIADAGKSIAVVVRSRCENRDFLASVLQVTMADLVGYHGELLRRRSAALKIPPGSPRCEFCREEAARRGVVVFACGHAYHPDCVLGYLAAEDVLNTELSQIDPEAFFAHPKRYSKVRKDIPYCCLCAQSRERLQR